MKFAIALAAGAACAVLGMLGTADAGQYGDRSVYRPHHLPPVSGVLQMNTDSFGRGEGRLGDRWAMHGAPRGRFGRARPTIVDGRSYGSGDDEPDGLTAGRPDRHFYGPAYGRQADAFSQLARGGDGAREHGRFPPREQRWNGDGTGVIGILGDGGSLFSSRSDVVPEAPLQVAYGEPEMPPGGGYGMPPTGGLAYYGSGSPGRLPYYSSGSSAGPYGSPGGLAIYSSGAYGPGPHVINLSRRQAWAGSMRRNCACGPHIIRIGQRQRHRADW